MQIHVIPTLVSLCFFLFLLLVGRGFFALVRLRMPGTAVWLLSPAMGLALLTLHACILNQAGFPIRTFGLGLFAGLTLVAIGVLAWRRSPVPWMFLLKLFALAIAWHLTVGFPLLRFGYDWVSFANDDYTNYCLGATRLLTHGFFTSPTAEELGGTDPSGVLWFLHVNGGARAGTDFVLATVSATFGVGPREAFMPVILAFGLTQAWAIGGMLALSSRFRKAAVPASVALAALPLFGLGIYYQLFAQVGGLALMWLTVAVLSTAGTVPNGHRVTALALSSAAAVAALLLFYPECAPFALLPATIMLALTLCRKPTTWKRHAAWVLPAVLVTLALLNRNIGFITGYLGSQLKGGTNDATGLFPYFLNVDAWTKWLGWSPFYGTPSNRLALLAVGAAVLAVSVLIRRCWVMATITCVTAVFALMTAMLSYKQAGFGLFKLAMFTQPVLAAGIAVGWRSCSNRWLRAVIAAALLASTIPAWKSYQGYASGAAGGPCESPFVSKLGFPSIPGDVREYQVINMRAGLEKLVVLSMPGKVADPIPLSVSDLYWHRFDKMNLATGLPAEPDRLQSAENFWAYETEYPQGVFHFYCTLKEAASPHACLVEPHPLICPFNRLESQTQPANWFTLRAKTSARNRLAWQPSEIRGIEGKTGSIILSNYRGLPVTPDIADPVRTLGIVGRNLLFSVIQPSPEIYVRVAFTRTYTGKGRVQLAAKATVTGGEELNLGFTGSGSANVIVGPLKPHSDKARELVYLDLGAPPQPVGAGNPGESTGLVRDVSALSPESYRSLKRPGGLSRFPGDLIGDPGLEYSGFYEDGWMDKTSWLILSAPKGRPSELHISGRMDGFHGLENGNSLAVSINGLKVRQLEIGRGEFTVSVPVPAQGNDAVKIGLEWAKSSSLPPGDDRPVAAWIRSIQLQPH